MAAKSKKSVLRTLRIPADMDALLVRDAEEKGISVNALVSSMMMKYSEWDRYIERFGVITVTRTGYRGLLELVPEERLIKYGEEAGSRNPKEMTLFWFRRLDLESFLAYMRIITRYGRLGEMEVERDGRAAVISIHHDMGPKYTKWLKSWMNAAVREVVGVIPRIQTGHASVVVRIEPN